RPNDFQHGIHGPQELISQPGSSLVVELGRLNEFGGGESVIDDALHGVFFWLRPSPASPGFLPSGARETPSLVSQSLCSKPPRSRVWQNPRRSQSVSRPTQPASRRPF